MENGLTYTISILPSSKTPFRLMKKSLPNYWELAKLTIKAFKGFLTPVFNFWFFTNSVV